MNTLSIVGSVSRQAGGLFESVRRLHQGLQSPPCTSRDPQECFNVRVLGLRDRFTDMDIPAWAPVPVRVFDPVGPCAFGFAPGLFREMARWAPDLVHVHGLWQFTSLAGLFWRRKTRRPLVISPHGMLDSWALKHSRSRKVISWLAYERDHLRSATCIRALCEPEARSIRALGFRNPICVIPNGIDLPVPEMEKRNPDLCLKLLSEAAAGKHKVLLYLGRFHPKKGLANLLKAWAKIGRENQWLLVLAGWDQGKHEVELKELATGLGIRWAESASPESRSSVLFAGPQFGQAKHQWLERCDAVILPSFSEGLPMALLEAWAHRKPVLMTPQCNLAEGFISKAALSILPQPDSIAEGLKHLFHADPPALEAMGARGHALVSDRFAWPNVVSELQSVYRWMIGHAPPPTCLLT